MKNLLKNIMAAGIAVLALGSLHAETVTMHLPSGFQVLGMSPNGQWACGVFVDAGLNTYAFRWNLLSGSYDLLDTRAGTAWDVADDGTVSGDFDDAEVMENGAPVPMPGYWRDGYWHHLEMPQGVILDGFGGGISADGQYMTGTISVNGRYTPFIWKNGKIDRSLDTGSDAVSYAVTPDGSAAAGFSTQYNRTACYWTPEGKLVYFMDSPQYSQGPWNYSRNFSPDGTKLLYWGGWEVDQETLYLYSIYDITTGERIRATAPGMDSDLEFYDISNNGTLVGQNQGRGYIWSQGEGMYIDDYLAKRNVDITHYEDFYSSGDYYVGQLPISRVVAMSEDENVLVMNYYNKAGEATSMVVKIDQDLSHVVPAQVTGRQLEGLNTVALNWTRPVGVSAVRGYNVYRDGKKINGMMPINVPYYYDRNLVAGTYAYEVSAVTTAGVETRAEALTVNVAGAEPQQPLNLFARQRGINDALLTWQAPMSDMTHRRYYDPAQVDYTGFVVYGAIDMEMGVRYDKAEIANYNDHKITEVSFYPLERHPSWSITFYTFDTEGKLQLIAEQPVTQQLELRALNTVKLDQPLDVPSGDLIVAVRVKTSMTGGNVIATQNGKTQPGYSDLLRQTSEDDFYSVFDTSLETALTLTSLTWAIDLGLEPEGHADTAVDHYNVYVDNAKVASTTNLSYVADALGDGTHTVGVEAEYAGGATSRIVDSEVAIAAVYPAVEELELALENVTSPKVTVTWAAPTDRDLTDIAYTKAKSSNKGITGNETNSYALMAGAQYPAKMFRGYEGYKVHSFRFYPLTDALFTFILFEGENEVAYVEVEDYKVNQWNELVLPDDVRINANTDYRLVIDCFDPVPGQKVLAIDSSAPRSNYSDLYSVDNGENWNSLTVETGSYGNWMMGMTLVDEEERAVEVEGYDVVIDGKVVNGAPVTEREYTHDFGTYDEKDHTLSINARYGSLSEPVDGRELTFKLVASGINDALMSDLQVRKGLNQIEVTGANVKGISLVATDGRKIAETDGACIDTRNLAKGVYVLEVYTPQGKVSQKIRIK